MNEQNKLSQFFKASANTSFPLANVSARDFKSISLQITASGGADFWIRVKGSNQVSLPTDNGTETPPDFTSAPSATNNWHYVQIENTATGNFIAGATGFHISADGTYIFELNQDVWAWVAFEIFSYASGDCVGQFLFKNNA